MAWIGPPISRWPAGSVWLHGSRALGIELAELLGTKLDMVRSLGADHVVDYTRDDFTKEGDADSILDIAARRTLVAHLRALALG